MVDFQKLVGAEVTKVSLNLKGELVLTLEHDAFGRSEVTAYDHYKVETDLVK